MIIETELVCLLTRSGVHGDGVLPIDREIAHCLSVSVCCLGVARKEVGNAGLAADLKVVFRPNARLGKRV